MNIHIAVISNLPPPSGGAEVLGRDLVVSLCQKGVEVTVYTQSIFEIQLIEGLNVTRYPYNEEDHLHLKAMGIKIQPAFKSSFLSKMLKGEILDFDSDFVTVLKERALQEKADLIHCHFTTGKLREAHFVSHELGIPLVVTCHGMTNLTPQYDSFVRGGLSSQQILDLLKSSAQTVVVSEQMLNYCTQNELQNVTRIPGGVNTKFYCPNEHKKSGGIVYVGKLNKHKGLKEALVAFIKIEKDIKDNLYLAGRGTCKKVFEQTGFYLDGELRKKAGELIKKGRIYPFGELPPEELREYYRSSRVMILPSLTEGFPISILEALACGTPVIASDVGSVSDVITNGRNGYLIPKGDTDALARFVKKVIDSSSAHLSDLCRWSVKEHDIDQSADHYLQLFQTIIEKNKSYV